VGAFLAVVVAVVVIAGINFGSPAVAVEEATEAGQVGPRATAGVSETAAITITAEMAAVVTEVVEETEAAIEDGFGRTRSPFDRPAIILQPCFTSTSSIRSGWPLTVASTMSPTPAT
jgi:hypothetical protein